MSNHDLMTTAALLGRIKALADEVHEAAEALGLRANMSLHGAAWPAGLEPTGDQLVTCYGHGDKHGTHRSAHLGRVQVVVARDATPEETDAEPKHNPRCARFRREAYLP